MSKWYGIWKDKFSIVILNETLHIRYHLKLHYDKKQCDSIIIEGVRAKMIMSSTGRIIFSTSCHFVLLYFTILTNKLQHNNKQKLLFTKMFNIPIVCGIVEFNLLELNS